MTTSSLTGPLLPAAALGLALAASSLVALRRRRRRSSRALPSSAPDAHYASALRGRSSATGSAVVAAYGRRSPASTGGVDGRGEKPELYVVTGATSGLGLETARHLASLPRRVHIILGCRNVALGNEVAEELNRSFDSRKSEAECIHLDLASFASVRAFATEVISRSKQLGVPISGCVNNAGVYSVKGTTADGYQITFQTNTLAPALLTELLLPHTSNDCRVVNVSSEMMKMVLRTRKEGRAFPPIDGGDSSWDYALSKACQGLHAHGLNLRWAKETRDTATKIPNRRRAFAIEPGIVETNIMRHYRSWTRRLNYLLFAPIVRTVDQGTATILFCLLAPEAHLDCGATGMGAEGGAGLDVKPFYLADCVAKTPPRCCRRREDAEIQRKVFEGIFAS
ncbi:hypothetical protein ACHAXT_009719 [Thalassiosira profunda]